jgi:hypothetical protein
MFEAEVAAETDNTCCHDSTVDARCVDAVPDTAEGNATATECPPGEPPDELLEQFPPEIATLLIMAGVAGVLLPGPIGAPLILAGGVTLWPKTFRPIERWFHRRFPAMHREGVIQLKEFVKHLKDRYPDLQ